MQVCLVHDPELRASPKDLLNSDLLPPRVGDDSIEETIRLLCALLIYFSSINLSDIQLLFNSAFWNNSCSNTHYCFIQPNR